MSTFYAMQVKSNVSVTLMANGQGFKYFWPAIFLAHQLLISSEN